MKKIICLLLCILSMSFIAIGCTNKNKNLPSGFASEIWCTYDDSYGSEAFGRKLENVYFEYLNENTIKITDKNGKVIIIDSSHLDFIKVDTSK